MGTKQKSIQIDLCSEKFVAKHKGKTPKTDLELSNFKMLYDAAFLWRLPARKLIRAQLFKSNDVVS